MTEKPILFSGEMVKAILDGRKTQTRRISGLRDANKHPDAWEHVRLGDLGYMAKKRARGKYGATFQSKPGAIEPNTISICPQICPYGRPGDFLWVRETWQYCPECGLPNWKAYANDSGHACQHCDGFLSPKWKPSIHMFREDSRITLRVTAVRVERVQDISIADVLKEGVLPEHDVYGFVDDMTTFHEFEILWNSINAKRGFGWEVNPWVWCITFELATPQD